jgi:hypothetical protein
MKKMILLALVALLVACKPTRQQQAEALVKKYLIDSALNDPDSYAPVNFGSLTKLDGTLYNDDKSNRPDSKGILEISHTFRYKNQFGGIITKTLDFYIDPNFTRAYGPPILNKNKL